MPQGKIISNTQADKDAEYLDYVKRSPDRDKLRMSMEAISGIVNEKARKLIEHAYLDIKLHKIYHDIRENEIYDKSHGKAHHREVLRYPNGYVADFVNTVLEGQYGPHWDDRKRNPKYRKAMSHELVLPWRLSKKL